MYSFNGKQPTTQIAAGPVVEPTTINSYNAMFYNASGAVANQYSEVTISSLVGASYIAPAVRVQSGSNSMYAAQMQASGGLSTIVIITNGTGVALGPSVSTTTHAGDVLRLSVIGNVLTLFQNGHCVLQVEDTNNTFATGSPGMAIYASATTNAQVSTWAGGNANIIPPYLSSLGFSNPVYINSDTSVAAGTNWKGANGGSIGTGGIGIRPGVILVTPTGAAFNAGNIVINEVNADGSTGRVLFSINVLATQPPKSYFFNAPPGWHDFVVTGVTATGAALEIYYRV